MGSTSGTEQGHLSQSSVDSEFVDYERLTLSLQSPLPNDQDFAITVCTLLSNDCQKVLKLAKVPHLLNLLLGHAGIYNDCSVRYLYEESYHGRNLQLNQKQFWEENVKSLEIRNLLCESFLFKHGLKSQSYNEEKSTQSRKRRRMSTGENYEENVQETVNKSPISKTCCPLCSCQRSLNISDFEDTSQYSHLKILPRNEEDKISQRILQITFLLRNLSFEDDNAFVMASNESMIRFIFLGVNCCWEEIPQMSYDMLGNVAKYFVVQEPSLNPLSSMMIDVVTKGLFSTDRFIVIRCLEILRELSKNEQNESIISVYFDKGMYSRLADLLSVNDVMLLIYTLECILALTQLTATANNELVNVLGFVSNLISLLTVNAHSYVPDGCISMRVEEVTEKFENSEADSLSKCNSKTVDSSSVSSSSVASVSTRKDGTASLAAAFSSAAFASRQINFTEKMEFPVLSDYVVSSKSDIRPLPNTPLPIPVQDTSTEFTETQSPSGSINALNDSHKMKAASSKISGFSKEDLDALNLSSKQLDRRFPFRCQWANCGMRFSEPEPVYMHAMTVHCSESLTEATRCEWGRCSTFPRSRFSLMMHLKEHHCSGPALKRSLKGRRNKLEVAEVPIQAERNHHPTNSRYMAFYVMKKRAIELMNFQELLDEKEGCVTKSIRLTAALILRNLVNFSDKGRKMCRRYESLFASIAMSNVESARTVAQILYDLN